MPDHMVLMTLFNRATEALDRADLGSATALCEEMLEQHRNDLNALGLLARIASRSGRFDEAIELTTKMVKQRPKDPEFRTLLGNAYVETGRFPSALAQYDKAIKLDPGDVDAIAGKAHIYELQGKRDRVRKVLASFLDDPEPPVQVGAVLVRLLAATGELDRAIEVGRRVVDEAADATVPVRDTAFALSQAYEKNGDYEDAFEAARTANAILPAPYERDRFRRREEALTEAFTRERIAAAPHPARPSELPVFIACMPRSGSTLVERIIQAHPRAYGAGEISALHVIVNAMPERIGSALPFPACVEDLDADDAQTLADEYVAAVSRLAPRADRITNKDPGCVNHLGVANILFPQGRIIVCRRDPVDTCLSCYLGPLLPHYVPYASDLEDLGWHHRHFDRLVDHWKRVLDAPLLEVQYEELVQDQRGMTERIIEFCGLEWDDACLRFHEAGRSERTLSYDQVRKPMYSSSVGRAERFGSRLDPLRRALADDST
jgi:Flp pilus assembly protein TadD